MRVAELKNSLEDYAKDNKLNLSSLISQENYSGLDKKHVWGISLACAYALENQKLIEAFEEDAKNESILDEAEIKGIKTAVSLMAMNNVYYRFIHLADDQELSRLPAGLRMNAMLNPGIDKEASKYLENDDYYPQLS